MLSAWSIAARRSRVAASSARDSMAMMPCPTAGMNASASSVSVAASARPSRLRPASASNVASTSPASSLRRRVSTLPRNDTTARSGRSRFTSACRRSDAVPTTAPAGSSPSDFDLRLMKTSRGSSRGSTAVMMRPSGSAVGMSLAECTARSTSPAASASSISLVNSPLPPTSDSGRSRMASPVVRMIRTSMRSGARPWAAARHPRTIVAWASASGLPRVPIRRATEPEDCTCQPRNATPNQPALGCDHIEDGAGPGNDKLIR